MIGTLNALVEAVESDLGAGLDVARFARRRGSTEYHLRRMFASLAGMPLSAYVRRRRMTVAVGDVLGDDTLLDIAVRSGTARPRPSAARSARCTASLRPRRAGTAVPSEHSHSSGSA